MSESCAAIIDGLIERRHDQGMTQKELADAASLTQSVIARLENKKATPQLDTLQDLILRWFLQECRLILSEYLWDAI